MSGMEVIAPSRGTARPSAIPVIGGTVVGTLLIVIGVVLGYVALATPFLALVVPAGRPGAGETVVGMVLWSLALVGPAGLVLVGATRLARIIAAARARNPRPSPFEQAIADLPGDIAIATGLTLPDGRGVSDLLLGPFGAAIIRELPPRDVTRVSNGHWELRMTRGWVPIESPLERATRDAERVRRWLAHDDADFIVKTYAAVVGPAPSTPRTTDCAVLAPDQLVAWIAALPAQRSLTPGRRERILEHVREAVA